MTLTKAEANRINGMKGGRPKGRKDNKTLEREAARKAYEQMVLENLRPLFQKQLLLANGVNYVYRIDRHERKSESGFRLAPLWLPARALSSVPRNRSDQVLPTSRGPQI